MGRKVAFDTVYGRNDSADAFGVNSFSMAFMIRARRYERRYRGDTAVV
jgi:hypothetical protein